MGAEKTRQLNMYLKQVQRNSFIQGSNMSNSSTTQAHILQRKPTKMKPGGTQL